MAASRSSITPSLEPAFTRLIEHLKDVTQNPSVTLDPVLLFAFSKEVTGRKISTIG